MPTNRDISSPYLTYKAPNVNLLLNVGTQLRIRLKGVSLELWEAYKWLSL